MKRGSGSGRREPKFLADAMLGSLARKLRIFGYDTCYFKEGDDDELERVARSEGRVILTSDKGLSASARRNGLEAILIRGKTDRARIASLSLEAGIEARLEASRCAVCNGVLSAMSKEGARAAGLPVRVVENHRSFYRCGSCSKVYWRGKHWDRLRRLSPKPRPVV